MGLRRLRPVSYTHLPEIRTGQLKDGRKVTLKEGQTYTLTTRQLIGDENIGYINYSGLGEDVVPGNKILIDDGLIEMDVMAVSYTNLSWSSGQTGAGRIRSAGHNQRQ